MPNLEEHCEHTLRRYGVEGRGIHQWLDEPSRKYASQHRGFRHDSETVRLVGEIFGKRYGQKLAEEIALDHIMLDHREGINRRNEFRRPQRTVTYQVGNNYFAWFVWLGLCFFGFCWGLAMVFDPAVSLIGWLFVGVSIILSIVPLLAVKQVGNLEEDMKKKQKEFEKWKEQERQQYKKVETDSFPDE